MCVWPCGRTHNVQFPSYTPYGLGTTQDVSYLSPDVQVETMLICHYQSEDCLQDQRHKVVKAKDEGITLVVHTHCYLCARGGVHHYDLVLSVHWIEYHYFSWPTMH